METSKGTHNEQSPFFPLAPIVQLVLIVTLLVATFIAGTMWKGGSISFSVNPGQAQQTAKLPAVGAGTDPTKPTVSATEQQTATLVGLAKEVSLNEDAFKACLTSGEMAKNVGDDKAQGSNSGISGTPGIILLNTSTGKNAFIPGAYPYESVKKLVDEMLAGQPLTLPDQSGKDAPATEAPNAAPVVADDFVRGNRSAQIAMIEYSDFECPYCKRFYPTAQQIQTEYADKVMWVYRQLPLPATMHPNAQKYAEASECAAKLGGNDAFWKYADKLNAL